MYFVFLIYIFYNYYKKIIFYVYYLSLFIFFFFFNDTATTEIYTLSLHDALPILIAKPEQLERHEPALGRDPHAIAHDRRFSDFRRDLFGEVKRGRYDNLDLNLRPVVPEQHRGDPGEARRSPRYSRLVNEQ